MKKLIPILLLLLCGSCAARKPKPCQIERIGLAHRQEMIDAIDRYPALMRDMMKTMAELENETGHYQ